MAEYKVGDMKRPYTFPILVREVSKQKASGNLRYAAALERDLQRCRIAEAEITRDKASPRV